ncbi:hypothetical protein BXY70_1351 [Roseovarius halotolerans]|uniref:Uncharacterized protein n=1 Tax=Roseovarius halotolerans TaxID=505353 RepID=A0A1X6Y5F0_9RHOB|nr:hypothetical protein [Roseovarius halotolerans]RKT35318.1 hypothetical protein BXY70_1351 [Roseovarius halotolerans]SLN10971.1 hypothetical protein ROH8110_00045 [Roseovarius halotolerans]
MKQASYEDAFGAGVCPILEDSDLDAMTDEQMQEELSNWQRQAGGPLEYVVEDNIRLVERHIELRAASDDDLFKGISDAEAAIEHWTPKLDGEDGWLARRIIRSCETDLKDFRREMDRRAKIVS